MPAAISAPNTHSSSTSVIGTEVTSAWRKSELTMLLVARSTLAWPDSATRRPGWRGLDGGDGALRGDDRLVGVVRVARDVEHDQRGAAVPRDQLAAARGQRRLDAGGDLGHGAQGRGHLPDGPADLRVTGHGAGAAPGLDQDGLGGGLDHAGPAQHPLGPARLAGVVAVQVLGAEHAADHHGADDQQQPAEQRGLAVPGAPARRCVPPLGADVRRGGGGETGSAPCSSADGRFMGASLGLGRR